MPEKTAARPNFLVFCTDQQGSYALGCNANPDIRTPNVDRLAREGATFVRAYCSNPVCMPSRASIFTGLTPRQHGCTTNGVNLPESVPTVVQALADAGYRTHAVGKLHLHAFGPKERDGRRPFSWEDGRRWREGDITGLPAGYYGFQTADYVGGHVDYCFGDYENWLVAEHPGVRELYGRGRSRHLVSEAPPCRTLPVPDEHHYNTWIADRASAFLSSVSPGQSFFLWCSFPDPHFPFAACERYRHLFDPASLALRSTWNDASDPCGVLADFRANWGVLPEFDEATLREVVAQTYGMIAHIDASIGRVLDALEGKGLAQKTVVAVLSDHGEYLGAHHLVYKGAWPYEELYRVPFLWRVPSGARGQRVGDRVVSLLDFAPTVLDYAGVEESVLDRGGLAVDRPFRLPGRSLRKTLDTGEALTPRPALVEFEPHRPSGQLLRQRTIVEERFKLTVFAPTGEGLLRDLVEDPDERVNLWDDPSCRAEKARLLHTLVEELARTDPFGAERIADA